MAKLWTGVAIAVQSALATASTITAITKANPAVVSDDAHGYSNGDYLVLSVQGMHEVNNRVVRVANKTTDTYELEGVDSTDYNTFSSGSGQKITFGTTLTGVTDNNVSGGEFDDIDISTIHGLVKVTMPGSASPIKVSMTAHWDPADASLVALKAASDAKSPRAVRFTFSDGTKWLFSGYVGCTLAPGGSGQQKVTTPLSFSVNGRSTAYAT